MTEAQANELMNLNRSVRFMLRNGTVVSGFIGKITFPEGFIEVHTDDDKIVFFRLSECVRSTPPS